MTNYPANLDDSSTIPVESAATPLSINHVIAHQNIQDAIEAIEAKVGADSSAVTSSHDYKLSEVTDKAVGKTATQTLTNKTLTSPVVNVGSDATGDMYYRNAGVLTRIPVGSDNQIMKLNGTTPNWEAESTTVNGSTTAAGIFEASTATELADGTTVGSTGALLVPTNDLISYTAFGNGADGALTYDGSTTILGMVPAANVYTLTRDIYGTTITVNSGVTIETAGYRIFANVLLSNAGTIKRTPNNGGNASGATAGTAGTALSSGTIYGGLAGIVGASGTSYGGIGTGNVGTAGTPGTAQTESIGVAGVAGAAGGAGGGDAGIAGAAGAAGARTASVQGIGNVAFATSMREFQLEVIKYIKGASGTGGSGSGSTRSSGSAGNTGAGGGSGSTGGIVWIAARVITNTGTISALGGNGGNGGNGSGGTANGGGGAGSGGSGGVVVLIYKGITLGTVTVTGGTAGTAGTGNGGAANGGAGTAGNTGVIIQITA